MHILFVTPTLSRNSLGRTYSMWLLTEHLGWSSEIYAAADEPVWSPLAGSDFAAHCHSDPKPRTTPGAVIAIKPMTESFRPARSFASQFGVPLIVDIDDPEVQAHFGETRRAQLRQVVGKALRGRPLEVRDRLSAWAVHHHDNIVSNPSLLAWYPGASVVPHVRPKRDMPFHVDRTPVVGFVGTPRRHKGIGLLRDAVARAGLRLIVTAEEPEDARPNERWVGETSLAEGQRILAESDIVALPSLKVSWGRSQFPVKVLDAMMAGRAIIASDLPPLRWATNGGAVLIPPGEEAELADALARLSDCAIRQKYGELAHREAVQRFTPAAVASTFDRVVTAALEG